MGSSKLTYKNYQENMEFWLSKGIGLPMWATELFDKGYESVCAIDFYHDVFGEDLEEHRVPEDYKTGDYGAIAIERTTYKDKDGELKVKGRRITVTKGNLELYDLIDKSEKFCMIAPLSYAGKKRTNENVRFMYALVIEVDNIIPKSGLEELIYSWNREKSALPKPTYMVCSGSGIHLYYVFERPIPMFRNIFEQMSEAKTYLTPKIWNKYVTKDYQPNKIQYESINQPFRCVGTITKNEKAYVMAFKVGEKVTIEYMNSFLPEKSKINVVYRSKRTLMQAKELYPGWYQRKIIEKRKGPEHWNRYKGIYFDWIEKIKNGAVVGHRYNCLENLCSLAVQCQIEPEQVEKDCREIAEYFDALTISEDNHFTEYDILCALRTYHEATEQAYKRKIEYITAKTGIEIKRAKRNGRPREKHVKMLNDQRKYKRDELSEDEYKNNGRPEKREIVIHWRLNNPSGSKKACVRDTGLSKTTVSKWWNTNIDEPQKGVMIYY